MSDTRRPLLYLAGALHHASQRQHLEMVTLLLQDAYEVYLPHRDGGQYARMVRQGQDMDQAARSVRDNDVAAIRACDVLLAASQRRYIDDAGVCFEIGFAHALGKPVVVYAPDLDTSATFNPMLRASISRVVSDYRQLVGGGIADPVQSKHQQEKQ